MWLSACLSKSILPTLQRYWLIDSTSLCVFLCCRTIIMPSKMNVSFPPFPHTVVFLVTTQHPSTLVSNTSIFTQLLMAVLVNIYANIETLAQHLLRGGLLAVRSTALSYFGQIGYWKRRRFISKLIRWQVYCPIYQNEKWHRPEHKPRFALSKPWPAVPVFCLRRRRLVYNCSFKTTLSYLDELQKLG